MWIDLSFDKTGLVLVSTDMRMDFVLTDLKCDFNFPKDVKNSACISLLHLSFVALLACSVVADPATGHG